MAETLYDVLSTLSQVSRLSKGMDSAGELGRPGCDRLSQVKAGDLPHRGLEKEGIPRQSNSASTEMDATGVFIGSGREKWGGHVKAS